MTIHIYNTPTAPEHIYKDISTVITPADGVSGAVRGAISIDAPVVELSGSWRTGNYAYIPDFGRYYWIRGRDLERKDLTVLVLESDPLMSFSGQILDLPVLVDRCEKQALFAGDIGYNGMIPDPRQIVLARQQVQVKHIMSFSWSGNYNLVTVG